MAGYTTTNHTAANDAESVDVSSGNQVLKNVSRGIYVGTAGDLALVTAKGTTVTFSNVPVGILPVQAKQINNTGTTASDIVALF